MLLLIQMHSACTLEALRIRRERQNPERKGQRGGKRETVSEVIEPRIRPKRNVKKKPIQLSSSEDEHSELDTAKATAGKRRKKAQAPTGTDAVKEAEKDTAHSVGDTDGRVSEIHRQLELGKSKRAAKDQELKILQKELDNSKAAVLAAAERERVSSAREGNQATVTSPADIEKMPAVITLKKKLKEVERSKIEELSDMKEKFAADIESATKKSLTDMRKEMMSCGVD